MTVYAISPHCVKGTAAALRAEFPKNPKMQAEVIESACKSIIDGKAAGFRAIAARHHATYLLICPNFPEGTIYQSRSPGGFYADLMRGQRPDWLVPVRLNTDMTLPYQLYRILYSPAGSEEIPQQR